MTYKSSFRASELTAKPESGRPPEWTLQAAYHDYRSDRVSRAYGNAIDCSRTRGWQSRRLRALRALQCRRFAADTDRFRTNWAGYSWNVTP